MDERSQKDRLEQELRFLKESFEADVISKEEFEKGKDRIERKLKEIIQKEKGEIVKKEHQEPKEEINIITEEKNEAERVPLSVIQEDHEEENHEDKKEEKQDESSDAEEPKEEHERESRFYKYIVVFAILAVVLFFGYNYFSSSSEAPGTTETPKINIDFFMCSSDNECFKDSIRGHCINPGTTESKCEIEKTKVNLLVINDRRNCFNCDTNRIEGILREWFGSLNVMEVDYGLDEGKLLAQRYGSGLLPIYLLDSNVTSLEKYGNYKQLFNIKEDSYVLKDDAAGASFYYSRNEMKNEILFFAKENDSVSIRAEKNLQEFLKSFPDVKFKKYKSTDSLAKELGIKTFPSFLVNNRIKFSGLLPSEHIKINFCTVNNPGECSKKLSSKLI